jgi:hypothetical protein
MFSCSNNIFETAFLKLNFSLMTEYLQELSYTVVPIVVFLLGAAFIYREYLNNKASLLEKEITLLKASREGKSIGAVAPVANTNTNTNANFDTLRIQAYERLVLYLERITPGALIMRLHQAGMSSKLLRSDMSKAVREELDHNLSQQIYVSEKSWRLVMKAKEETINLINIAQENVGDKGTGMDMSRVIFEILDKVKKAPNEDALAQLTAEARHLIKN